MLTLLYQGIIAVTLFFIVWEMFEQQDITMQLIAALSIIPLLLRLLKIA